MNSDISHYKLVSINNVLKQYDDVKKITQKFKYLINLLKILIYL